MVAYPAKPAVVDQGSPADADASRAKRRISREIPTTGIDRPSVVLSLCSKEGGDGAAAKLESVRARPVSLASPAPAAAAAHTPCSAELSIRYLRSTSGTRLLSVTASFATRRTCAFWRPPDSSGNFARMAARTRSALSGLMHDSR